MFGYLTLKNISRRAKVYGIYKFYYCGTCKALRYNYGLFASSVLSFDLVIVPAVLQAEPHLKKSDNYCDILRKKPDKPVFTAEQWKRIAAFNLAITDAHITDSLNDEKGMKRLLYKLVGAVLRRAVNKAKKDYPALFEATKRGMEKLIDTEKSDCPLERQAQCFGELCVDALRTISELDDDRAGFISSVSEWLCFIDALDDCKKDEKRGKYNPLIAEYGCAADELIDGHFLEINAKYARIKSELERTADSIKRDCGNDYLDMYAYRIIPAQTVSVFNRLTGAKRGRA